MSRFKTRDMFRHLIPVFICFLSVSLCPFSAAGQDAAENQPSAGITAPDEEAAADGSLRSTDAPGEILYTENEWNYVEGSMDISHEIPETATGRLYKIREAGKLTVATEPYFAPQEFIDPSLSGQAQYVGADMELAKLIAEKMGVELEIVPLDFTEVLNATADGEYDLAISGLAYTPGRASVLTLSKGYHYTEENASTGLMIRKEYRHILVTTEDLADRNIAAQIGSLQELLLAENVPHYHQFRRYASMQEIYTALEDGTIDAAAVDLETARLYIENNPSCGLYLTDSIRFSLDEQFQGDRIAAPKGELQLMYFVNGVIDEITKSGQYEKWFDEYTEYADKLGL